MSDELDKAIDAYLSGSKKQAAPVEDNSALDAAIDGFMSGRQQKPQRQQPRAYTPPTERQQFGQRRLPSPYERQSRFTFNRPARPQYAPGDERDELEQSVRQMGRRYSTPKNLALGAEQTTYGSFLPAAVTGLEALGSAMTGDFTPAREVGEQTLRGVGNLLMGGNPSFAGPRRANDAAIQRIAAERQARQSGSPITSAIEKAQADVEAEAALDPSLRGRIERGVGRYATAAAPAVITGALTGGSLPAIAGVTAAQSLNEPENLALNVGMGVLPAPPIGRLARRLRGRSPELPPARATNPTRSLDTRPLPQVAEPYFAPETTEIPVISRAQIERAQTAGLPDYYYQSRTGDLPEIQSAPLEDFAVRTGRLREPSSATLVGPRAITDLAFQPSANLKPPRPPLQSPDAELGRVWARPPQQGALFDAAAKSPWQDSVLAYYRANLLTNPAGRALDLGSTVINQFADAAVRPIAAAVDVIVSKGTRQRSITGPSLRGSGKAFGSIRQGLRDAREVMRTGEQAIDSAIDDVLYGQEIRSGLGKAVDVPINGVFRVLGAMDAPFRRFGFERNLADRARVAAINEAKRGAIPRSQISARAAELVDRGDIIAAAVRDGERAVLSEPNRISSWLSRQTANSPNARLLIGAVQPFMRIPLNAVLRAADFSGVGGIKALYKIARGGIRKARGESFFRNLEEQRVFAQNVAAGSFGPAAFLLGMALEERGKLEGFYYTSKNDYPQGRTPTSINIGGENYDVNRLGGYILAPLFVGATYGRLRREGSDKANSLLRSFGGLIQTAPAMGYYGAPAKAGRILTADEPGSEIVKEAGSMTSGFIPASGAVGAAAKAIDRNRQREDAGFTGPIQAKIPGLRGQLPEKQRSAPARVSGAYAARGRELGLDPESVRPMKGEPKELFDARRQRIETWSDKYGERLVKHRGFARLKEADQKAAIKNLRESIHGEANDREPNLSLFEADRIIYAVQDRARRQTEKNSRKIYVEP